MWWRWTRRILVGFVVLLVALAGTGFGYQQIAERRDLANNPPPGRLVDVGGHRLHMVCTGSGSPTVVFDAGLGGTSFGWGTVPSEVAKFTSACAYDRAGQGYSDSGPFPRTSEQVAAELSTLIDKATLGPVIAVGASLGGFNTRLLATKHQEQVAGLVLLDASHEDQGLTMPPFATFVPLAGRLGVMRLFEIHIGSDYPATEFRTERFSALYAELTGILASAAQVRASRRELQIPVVVISAGRGTNEQWRTFQRDQLTLSRQSCQIVAERSGHVIQLRRPDAAVRGIRAAWEAARSGTAPNCVD
jgi:pimeloyl-ACP methyl ester carboxylesterase